MFTAFSASLHSQDSPLKTVPDACIPSSFSVAIGLDRFGKEPVRNVPVASGGNLLTYLGKPSIDLLDHTDEEPQWGTPPALAQQGVCRLCDVLREIAVPLQWKECMHNMFLFDSTAVDVGFRPDPSENSRCL